jgi:hypothetical protein
MEFPSYLPSGRGSSLMPVKREPDDIPSLWDLAKATFSGPPQKLDPKIFDRCLQIKTVGPAKLTMGMFWLNPRQYIALDENNRKLFEHNAINGEVKDFSGYLHLIQSVNAKLGEEYPAISRNAWEHGNDTTTEKQYWAGGSFRCSTSPVDAAEYAQEQISQRGHILLDFDHKEIRVKGRSATPPKLQGVSGGGIFQVRRETMCGPLVAIATRIRRASRLIVGTRISLKIDPLLVPRGDHRKHFLAIVRELKAMSRP